MTDEPGPGIVPESGSEPGPASGPETASVPEPGTARVRRSPGRVRTFLVTIRAVLTRELRWRMRGKRAFVIAAVTVLFLGLVVFGIYELMYRSAVDEARWRLFGVFDDNGFPLVDPARFPLQAVSGEASARIGQAIFGGVLGVLTALTLLVAPALASGVISSERERQTMELLVTTPVSTLGIIVGKLISSLAYVLLLIVASVPLMAVVFAFGGVAPEDVLRAYTVLLVIAFGSAALGLFLSALIGRTQIATVVSYLILFGLVAGTLGVHSWMYVTSDDEVDGNQRTVQMSAPEPLLWLNPLVADIDLMCNAVPEATAFCDYISLVRGFDQQQAQRQGVRDEFWPRFVAAFMVAGTLLLLLATQLISPSRRWRAWRRVKAPPPDHAAGPSPEPAA